MSGILSNPPFFWERAKMKPFRLLLVVVIALVAVSAFARTWTDKQGNKTQAKFIRYFDGNVVVQRGIKVILIPFDDLCEEDQDYVRKQLEAKGQGNLLPPKVTPSERSTGKEDDIRLAEPGPVRTWTDVQGREIQAQLVGIKGDGAVLLYKGREVTVPLKKLSPEDRRYVEAERDKARKSSDPIGRSSPPPPVRTTPTPMSPSPPGMPHMPRYTPPAQPSPPMMPGPGPSFPRPSFPKPSFPQPSFPQPSFPQTQRPNPTFSQPRNLFPDVQPQIPQINSPVQTQRTLSGAVIGQLIVGLIIGAVIGVVIGAVILRAACWMLNLIAGGDAVPQPNFGQAVGIAFSLVVVNVVVEIIAFFMLRGGVITPMTSLLLRIAVELMAGVAIISSALPTTPVKAFLIMVLELAIVIGIVILLFAAIGGLGTLQTTRF